MLAIVLARRDVGEFDQIISLYTKELGKQTVMAKSVKKIISKNSAFLEPFFLVDAEVAQGKEMLRLIKVLPINAYKNIRANFDKIILATHAINLLDKLLQAGEQDKNIFILITNYLNYLDSDVNVSEILSDAFLARLLKALGFDIAVAPEIPAHLIVYTQNLIGSEWKNIEQNTDKKCEPEARHELYRFASFYCERKIEGVKTCNFC